MTNKQNKSAPVLFHNHIPSLAQSQSLPGSSEDTVLAQYIGGEGRGTHYYRGPVTKHPYKVINGEIIKVDSRDAAREPGHGSKFILLETPKEVSKAASKPTFHKAPEPVKEPVVEETFQLDDNVGMVADDEEDGHIDGLGKLEEGFGFFRVKAEDGEEYDIPDVRNMSLGDLKEADLTPWEAKQMLAREEGANGKKRVKHITYLKRLASQEQPFVE